MPKVPNAKQTNEPAHQRQTAKPTTQKLVAQAQPVAPGVLLAMADPHVAGPSNILALQRTVGNRAVAHLIQAKLTVGPAGDQYEREADRVAEQVLSMPVATPTAAVETGQGTRPLQRQEEEEEPIQGKPLVATLTPLVQRQEEEEEVQSKPVESVQRQEEEEEPIQGKPLSATLTPPIQRQEEEEEVQAKPVESVQRTDPISNLQSPIPNPMGGFKVSGALEQRLAANQGGGNSLPAEARAYMEPRFGADFSGVRVHTDGEAAQLNRAVSAQAFTHGQDIYLGEGKYAPDSDAGKRLLAHELAHTIQQGASPLVQRDPGQSQPQAASVAAGAQPDVLQRLVEGEELLSLKQWKKKSSLGLSHKRSKALSKALKEIDAAIKDYSSLGEEEQNAVKRIFALEKISGLADRTAVQEGLNDDNDPRSIIKLRKAAEFKTDELNDQRTTAFGTTEVQEKRVREVVPSFYELKAQLGARDISPRDAAEGIFNEFVEYKGFTYTDTTNKTLKTGLFRGSCQDFSRALAELFREAGIRGAGTRTLDQHNFVTNRAPNFIDKSCPGNIKTAHGDYAAVKRFFFKEHDITTSEAGEFDPTAGVLGEDAVDQGLVGFRAMAQNDRARYGLEDNETGVILEEVSLTVLLKDLAELTPTGRHGLEMIVR